MTSFVNVKSLREHFLNDIIKVGGGESKGVSEATIFVWQKGRGSQKSKN